MTHVIPDERNGIVPDVEFSLESTGAMFLAHPPLLCLYGLGGNRKGVANEIIPLGVGEYPVAKVYNFLGLRQN